MRKLYLLFNNLQDFEKEYVHNFNIKIILNLY